MIHYRQDGYTNIGYMVKRGFFKHRKIIVKIRRESFQSHQKEVEDNLELKVKHLEMELEYIKNSTP